MAFDTSYSFGTISLDPKFCSEVLGQLASDPLFKLVPRTSSDGEIAFITKSLETLDSFSLSDDAIDLKWENSEALSGIDCFDSYVTFASRNFQTVYAGFVFVRPEFATNDDEGSYDLTIKVVSGKNGVSLSIKVGKGSHYYSDREFRRDLFEGVIHRCCPNVNATFSSDMKSLEMPPDSKNSEIEITSREFIKSARPEESMLDLLRIRGLMLKVAIEEAQTLYSKHLEVYRLSRMIFDGTLTREEYKNVYRELNFRFPGTYKLIFEGKSKYDIKSIEKACRKLDSFAIPVLHIKDKKYAGNAEVVVIKDDVGLHIDIFGETDQDADEIISLLSDKVNRAAGKNIVEHE